MSFYDYSAVDMTKNEVSMKDFKDKVVLVVNTASKCGYTPQFEGLEKLYEEYKDQGLEILGFPSNQFGKQDPGSNKEIQEFCQLNYGVTFKMFEKIDVNGENTHPLYKYLKGEQGDGKDITWNFNKFLIDRKGNVVDRFASQKKPENLKKDIEKLL